MSREANCTFKVISWDEKPYQEFEGGAKLTRAKVSLAYQGDISGEGFVEFLMSHAANGTASFVGMEWVKGVVAGKSGSFIIQHVGTYDSGGARSAWSIVPGSGTGELAGIVGKGSYVATSESVPFSFSYEFSGA
ncbi:MAG: DUF3224 domain-containing protein [Nitrospirae bacterium]|nr:DUF3224 domain-containing protein [Nitrospirota bacterium]MBI3351346.1 DUF3224 domain-containing protein [Nitrospirota bacterium]